MEYGRYRTVQHFDLPIQNTINACNVEKYHYNHLIEQLMRKIDTLTNVIKCTYNVSQGKLMTMLLMFLRVILE